MARHFKITIFILYCLSAFLLVFSPVYFDYNVLYAVGEIKTNDFYLYILTEALVIIIKVIISTIILGVIFVAISKVFLKITKKSSIGYFQKLWPYGFSLFFVASVQFTSEDEKSKIETFGPYYRAKNGVGIHKGITNEICKDFIQYDGKNKPNFDVFPQDEMIAIFNRLFEGKSININDLQKTLITLKEKKKILQNLSEQFNSHKRKRFSDEYEAEVRKFMGNNKRSQALPHALIEDIIYEVSVGGPKRQEKTIDEHFRLWFEYNSQIVEIAKEFCELLITEQGQYLLPDDDGVWKFKRESAMLQYKKITDKIEETNKLGEKLNQSIIEIQHKMNVIEMKFSS